MAWDSRYRGKAALERGREDANHEVCLRVAGTTEILPSARVRDRNTDQLFDGWKPHPNPTTISPVSAPRDTLGVQRR